MSGSDIAVILVIIIISVVFVALLKLIGSLKPNIRDVYDFERDYKQAVYRPPRQENLKKQERKSEYTIIGTAPNRRNVYIPNDAKHVFLTGTTGSGKTIAIANFIVSGVFYNYPMVIIDGKGDTGFGSLLWIVENLCPNRKKYIINLNDPKNSARYNPFKNTNTDVICDMLINMTSWSEPHYLYNTERFVRRLCKLLELSKIPISLETMTKYLPRDSFIKLSKDLCFRGIFSKEEHIEDLELSKTSGKISEAASARFSNIARSDLGQIFDSSGQFGIDIYTALRENAIILFVLNPLMYPEMSPLIGNLIIIDSKKAISNLYREKQNRIFYIFDEINTYANPSLLDLVNKSRSANVTCILATQSLSDLDAAVSPEFKEQILENSNNYIVLRQNSSVNAEHWSDTLGTRESMEATYQIKGESGEAKSTQLGSLRKTREYIYHPDDIKLLKTGEAIFLSRDNHFHTKVFINKPF